MLLIYTVGAPMFMAYLFQTPYAAAMATALNVAVLWCVNYLAVDIESPFGENPNGLPLGDEVERMNKLLKMLLMDGARRTPKSTGVSLDGRRTVAMSDSLKSFKAGTKKQRNSSIGDGVSGSDEEDCASAGRGSLFRKPLKRGKTDTFALSSPNGGAGGHAMTSANSAPVVATSQVHDLVKEFVEVHEDVESVEVGVVVAPIKRPAGRPYLGAMEESHPPPRDNLQLEQSPQRSQHHSPSPAASLPGAVQEREGAGSPPQQQQQQQSSPQEASRSHKLQANHSPQVSRPAAAFRRPEQQRGGISPPGPPGHSAACIDNNRLELSRGKLEGKLFMSQL